MKMFVPAPGDLIRLTRHWKFSLHKEYRNSDLFEVFDPQHLFCDPLHVTLPAGTVLKVERIYIKGAYPDYNSVTFRTMASPDGRLANRKNGGTGKSRRFWAKLPDVNLIEFEHVEELA
ncbi:MAG: hypothetical protein ABW128_16835 [Rhizorhabdus sp.]